MSGLVRICSQAELPAPGEVSEVSAEGRIFCVANLDGTIHVLNGECPHEGGPLGEGRIEDGRVVCPWHEYSFDLQTGAEWHDTEMKAEVYEAVVDGGELRVKL